MALNLPFAISGIQLNVAMIVLALVTIYYISLSKTLMDRSLIICRIVFVAL